MRSSRRRRGATARGREVVPVDRAVRLYDQLGSWRAVQRELLRRDGSRFTTQGIYAAVRWRDRGCAGFRL